MLLLDMVQKTAMIALRIRTFKKLNRSKRNKIISKKQKKLIQLIEQKIFTNITYYRLTLRKKD